MNECQMCNTHNPPQAVTCRTCKLSLPRSNAPSIFHTGSRPKMAVFDLDRTLFDLSRRERAAKRQGLKPGSNKWFEVINQNKYILMDTPIEGTVKFVNDLSNNGFTIAYLSGRPRSSLAATKQSLQESGFPIDADEQDLVFLHSGKGSIPNITNHKKSVLTHLKNKFDVDFFFDDTAEFREAAKSLFIPGVYPSIAAYSGKEARKNPASQVFSKKEEEEVELVPVYSGEPKGVTEHLGMATAVVQVGRNIFKDIGEGLQGFFRAIVGGRQSMTEKRMLMSVIAMHRDLSKIAHERGGNAICNLKLDYEYPTIEGTQEDITLIAVADIVKMKSPKKVTQSTGVKSNPPPMPRKKRAKNGSMRKEPMDKYLDRFMADKKMNEEFPDRSQRFAVALSYARKFYGDAAVDKKYPPRENPAVTSVYGKGSEVVVMDKNLQSMKYTGKTTLPKGTPYQLVKKLRSLLARDREHRGFVKDNKIYYGTSFGTHGVVWRPTNDVIGSVFCFHTHPYGFGKGMKGGISQEDLASNLYMRTMLGVSWEAVVQKRGINFVHTSIKEGSPLAKAIRAYDRAKTKETRKKAVGKIFQLLDSDEEVVMNMYKGESGRYFSKVLEAGPPTWGGYSALKYEVAMLKTANKFMKNFEFNMYYLEVPSVHADWTKDVTESYPLGKMEFKDIADYFKGYKQIKTNPSLKKTTKILREQAAELWENLEPKEPTKKLQASLVKYLKAKDIQDKLDSDELGVTPQLDSKMTYGSSQYHSKWSLRDGEGLVWLWNIVNNPDKKALSYFTNYLDEAGYFLVGEDEWEEWEAGELSEPFFPRSLVEAAKRKDFLGQNGPLRDRYIVIEKDDYEKLLSNLKWMAEKGVIEATLEPYDRGPRMSDKKKWGGWNVRTITADELNIFISLPVRSNPVRANPSNVNEAKKMYQQFHKKQPKSVKKKQIDFGDTWVGLGKAWSIGYRSGKETGDESQKYIHNFGVDEESGKKFAEPELYYVKNKDGSQMMVIMGGDWYIDVDEAGEVSWIYI